MIRLAIIEDHPAIAEGLGTLLADADDIELAGSASDATGAEHLLRHGRPDVVLCDVHLGTGTEGLELLESGITDAPFLVFTAYTLPNFYVRAMNAGAAGFITKTASVREIAAAVRTVAGGGTVFPPDAIRAARIAPRAPTDRELDILRLVAAGLTNAQVSEDLGIGERTVESQLRRMFDRYDASTRTALVRLAHEQGWIVAI